MRGRGVASRSRCVRLGDDAVCCAVAQALGYGWNGFVVQERDLAASSVSGVHFGGHIPVKCRDVVVVDSGQYPGASGATGATADEVRRGGD